jgi:hypothetical protein
MMWKASLFSDMERGGSFGLVGDTAAGGGSQARDVGVAL